MTDGGPATPSGAAAHSVGTRLAEARMARGLTVDDVAAATRIRATVVGAIERDDFGSCGGDFYARGHVRAIARVVGADADALVRAFDAARGGPPTPPRAAEVLQAESRGRYRERRGPNWSAAMLVALVLVLGYVVFRVGTGGGEDRGTTDVAGRPAASAPATPSGSATPTSTSSPTVVAKAPRTAVTVVLRATGRSWVSVRAGASGRTAFEGLVTPGSVRTFVDRSQLRLTVGNAGAITLVVNGRPLGSPGREGQVARVVFTPQDPAAG